MPDDRRRSTAVLTAQCWYDAAADEKQTMPDRLMGAINAFNHTENALFAARNEIAQLTKLIEDHNDSKGYMCMGITVSDRPSVERTND